MSISSMFTPDGIKTPMNLTPLAESLTHMDMTPSRKREPREMEKL